MAGQKNFYEKISKSGISCQHVAVSGVWHPDTSNVLGFILAGVRTTLVEPEPRAIALIEEKFGAWDNVELKKCAVCDFSGEVELFHCQSSTFLGSLEASPAIINDRYAKNSSDAFIAQAVTFDQIDDGTIDILSIDTEGSEWFVLKKLLSRPKVISLETHGGAYKNPYLADILAWMKINDYKLWYLGDCDSVYVRGDEVTVSAPDYVHNLLKRGQIFLAAVRKSLRNHFKRAD